MPARRRPPGARCRRARSRRRREPASRVDTKAISRPSGDQAGKKSLPGFASAARIVPARDVEHPHVVVAAAIRREGDLRAVRRPVRLAVVERVRWSALSAPEPSGAHRPDAPRAVTVALKRDRLPSGDQDGWRASPYSSVMRAPSRRDRQRPEAALQVDARACAGRETARSPSTCLRARSRRRRPTKWRATGQPAPTRCRGRRLLLS